MVTTRETKKKKDELMFRMMERKWEKARRQRDRKRTAKGNVSKEKEREEREEGEEREIHDQRRSGDAWVGRIVSISWRRMEGNEEEEEEGEEKEDLVMAKRN